MQAKKYIGDSIGERFNEGVILDLDRMFEESEARVPLICFLSMGSDPSNGIEQLSKRRSIELKAISMGQGQEVHARRLCSSAMANGGWVLLQNCHLSLDFCEEILDTIMTIENVNDGFRLVF